MPPIRRSNRAAKPKVYWEPPITNLRRCNSIFTIFTDPPEQPDKQPLEEPY